MEEQLISFETAKLAKEKGCDLESCTCGGYPECICYDKRISQSLLAKWLREEYNIIVLVLYDGKTFYYQIQRKEWDDCITQFDLTLDQTYEEAYEIGLQEALKLI